MKHSVNICIFYVSIILVTLTSSATIEVVEGGLSGTYEVSHSHFHWGKANANGSEHQIDGKSFPIEVNQKVIINILVTIFKRIDY